MNEIRKHDGHACFRYRVKRTDEIWITHPVAGGQAKVNMSKINSQITIYQDKACVMSEK